MNTTADGKREWESSCQDFNMGDLSSCLPCVILEKILAKHGIYKLTVETNSEDQECGYWSYDTVLIDGHGAGRRQRLHRVAH